MLRMHAQKIKPPFKEFLSENDRNLSNLSFFDRFDANNRAVVFPAHASVTNYIT